ncbi:AAA domain-containing protein [Collybia nuda]|uniref:AAA domain-containing protein n=1 Tax=Collybia nuda TaxID=64659 RepID=A0A9P5XXN6_9AGAR|nr:AAA domain-containing protein [Collybia nuda]
MPVPIGDFISKNVYNGRLHSKHPVAQMSCVSFINVAEGIEDKGGFSWRNFAEIRTIVHLVRSYYRHKNFCVITPYDAQRAAIEKALKDENLPWECVFNVDSFQGNEAKFVLISVVRSGGPGFLTSINRMNVMLTRCQAGLVVVTSRSFLHRGGWNTLLGKLARHWEDCRGDDAWVEWRSVAAEKVDLPGAPGRNKSSNPFGFVNQPPATVSFSPQPTPSFYHPSFPQAHFVGPIYGHDGYGFKHYFPPASSYYPTIHPFMGGLRNASMNRPVQPFTYDNYDEAFPSLHPISTASVLATTSPPTNPHSFLNAKPKPPKVSKPQEPIRPEPAPERYHPPPPRARRRAPQPKFSENHWQPVANNHAGRNQRYTLTKSSYRL